MKLVAMLLCLAMDAADLAPATRRNTAIEAGRGIAANLDVGQGQPVDTQRGGRTGPNILYCFLTNSRFLSIATCTAVSVDGGAWGGYWRY